MIFAPTTAGALRVYATTAAAIAAHQASGAAGASPVGVPAGATGGGPLPAVAAAPTIADSVANAANAAGNIASSVNDTLTGPGAGHQRALLDGIDVTRPFDIIPHALTNLTERISGQRDPRTGRALTQILLAGQQVIQAGLRHMAQGKGIIATSSSVLGKILPMVSMVSGAAQVWRGWNELQSHDGGPLALIHSKTARTGMLQVLAGALLFVPGVGAALGGALTRIGAAANEMDMFKSLDWASVPIEQRGARVARIAHPFDRTPTDASVAPAQQQKQAVDHATGAVRVDEVVNWVKDHLTPRND